MMYLRACAACVLFFMLHGCWSNHKPVNLKYKAAGPSPKALAVYEGWFGSPSHMSVGYSSHDPAVLSRQMQEARQMGISGFVVDWYADRDPFINQTYAMMQKIAAQNDFQIAVMYDEANPEVGATDEVISDLTHFHDTYLTPGSPGVSAYLMYQGRPVIFVFPHGTGTDWSKVRAVVDKWNPAPLLIDENLPGKYGQYFDGFYPWINPGPKGWSANGSNWGKAYLADFYQTMADKYPDKMIVGGAWAGFDDSKASWGLNRHIATRCGQTYRDTFNLWKKFFPAHQVIPFVLVETWNDYEEGSAIEKGIPACGSSPPAQTAQTAAPNAAPAR